MAVTALSVAISCSRSSGSPVSLVTIPEVMIITGGLNPRRGSVGIAKRAGVAEGRERATKYPDEREPKREEKREGGARRVESKRR